MPNPFKLFPPILFAAALVLPVGCRSTTPPVSTSGFHYEKLGEHRFLARFESDSLSAAGVKRNLIFNAARLTIDDGAIWFTTADVSTNTEVTKEKSTSTTNAATQRSPAAIPSPTNPSDVSVASVTIGKKTVASTIVTTYREKPSNPSALEASKVIEELGETRPAGER